MAGCLFFYSGQQCINESPMHGRVGVSARDFNALKQKRSKRLQVMTFESVKGCQLWIFRAGEVKRLWAWMGLKKVGAVNLISC